jgi:hypothetical protein
LFFFDTGQAIIKDIPIPNQTGIKKRRLCNCMFAYTIIFMVEINESEKHGWEKDGFLRCDSKYSESICCLRRFM